MLHYVKGCKLQLQRVNLNDLVAKICELNRQTAADQGVALRCELPDGLPAVLCDPKLIHMAATDLIVLDVMMPKRTGFVLFRQLKKDERCKDIPVLMLTGVSGVLEELESHKEETFEKPYDSLREALKKQIREMRDEGLVRPEMFVDKPVDLDDFIAQVLRLIGS